VAHRRILSGFALDVHDVRNRELTGSVPGRCASVKQKVRNSGTLQSDSSYLLVLTGELTKHADSPW
jgi:hypothetical protein